MSFLDTQTGPIAQQAGVRKFSLKTRIMWISSARCKDTAKCGLILLLDMIWKYLAGHSAELPLNTFCRTPLGTHLVCS